MTIYIKVEELHGGCLLRSRGCLHFASTWLRPRVYGLVRVKRIKEKKTLQNCTFLMKVKKIWNVKCNKHLNKDITLLKNNLNKLTRLLFNLTIYNIYELYDGWFLRSRGCLHFASTWPRPRVYGLVRVKRIKENKTLKKLYIFNESKKNNTKCKINKCFQRVFNIYM